MSGYRDDVYSGSVCHPELGPHTHPVSLRPRRVQEAAGRLADALVRLMEDVMDMDDAERQELTGAIRSLAEPR